MVCNVVPHNPDFPFLGNQVRNVIKDKYVGKDNGKKAALKEQLFLWVLWIKGQQQEAQGQGEKGIIVR